MNFLKSSTGRKLLMAFSGLGMAAFIVVHLLGNSSVYIGPGSMNTYAFKIHALGPGVWIFRLVMLTFFSVHVFFGIQLTLENSSAKPVKYNVTKNLRTTFAARTMIWTGLLIAVFILYHLLHFTMQVINPEIAASHHFDILGRPDVFSMVVLSLGHLPVSLGYVAAMIVLGLHLGHGLQSMVQTAGLNNDYTLPVVAKIGTAAAVIIFLGFAAIPIAAISGMLK